MPSDAAVDILRRLDAGEGITHAEIDTILREGLVKVVGEPPYLRITAKGNRALGGS